MFPKEAQEKLAAAEAAIAKLVATEADKAAAGAVTEAINALPAADEITLENKEAVEAARAAFDKLTETQQALVPKEAQEALAAAEAAIAKLEADAADKAAAAKVEEEHQRSACRCGPDPGEQGSRRSCESCVSTS